MAMLMKRSTLRELRQSVSVALVARRRLDAAMREYSPCHYRVTSALYAAAKESDTLETAYFSTKRTQLNERLAIESTASTSDSLTQLAHMLGREGKR